jgi:hypothetical protein
MRALGLLGLVVAIAVIVWIMSAVWLPSAQQAVNVKKKVEPQVQQMAGKDPVTGMDARDSITLKGDSIGGKLKSVTVSDIAAEGAMAKYFGLQKGDVILEIAPQGQAFMPVSDMSNPAEAKDLLLSSYQNSQQVIVLRAGKRLTLPAAPGGATPSDPVQKQIGDIKIPTH